MQHATLRTNTRPLFATRQQEIGALGRCWIGTGRPRLTRRKTRLHTTESTRHQSHVATTHIAIFQSRSIHHSVSIFAHREFSIVASSATSPEPYYATPSSIPHLSPARLNRLKLTPIRINQLHTAAARSINSPPPSPGLTECCGSSCGKDCVKSLHFEEVKAWSVRWWGEERWKEEWESYKERRDAARCQIELEGEELAAREDKNAKDSDKSPNIPGSFSW